MFTLYARLRPRFSLAILAAACVAHAQPGDRTWCELRTDCVLLPTDLDDDDARDRATEFERLAAARNDRQAVVVPRRPTQVRPIRVIYGAMIGLPSLIRSR